MALFATIDVSTAGSNLIVPADVNQSIIVVNYVLAAAGSVTAKWEGEPSLGALSQELSGPMSLAAGTPLEMPGTLQDPLFVVKEGLALVLILGGNVQVSGHLSYYYSGDD